MFASSPLTKLLGISAVAVAAVLAPLAASAQDVPSYAAQSYSASTDETIHGRIRSVDGAFDLTVDDDRGFVDNVELHSGTIINPTGLTLSEGMSITVTGYNAGSTFDANEIDTPYTYDGPLPTPVYIGPGYWYPGFAYGYGPAFCLSVDIGGGYGGGWRFAQRPFSGRPWNGHAYFGVAVGPLERGHVALNGGDGGGRGSAPGGSERRYPSAGEPESHQPAAFVGRTFAGESRAAYSQAVPSREFSSVESNRPAYESRPATAPAANYATQRPAYGGGASYNRGGGSGASYNRGGGGSGASYNRGGGSGASYNRGGGGSGASYNRGGGGGSAHEGGHGH